MMSDGNRPDEQNLREQAERYRSIRRDLRGAGWSALACELINSFVALYVIMLFLTIRVKP